MFSTITITKRNFFRKTGICFAFIAMGFLTFGSSGGGGGGKSRNDLNFRDFTPIRTTGGFTLKAGPLYRGSQLLNMHQQSNGIVLSTVITYQRGNTTFILPYKYRMAKPAEVKSNLNALDVKIPLHK
jgi:hypothetical protein